MKILDQIINWSESLPGWQRDALRRLSTQEALSDQDINQILGMLKNAYGLSDPDDPTPEPTPITRKDFGVPSPGGPVVTLLRMSGLKNVNALAPDQTLDFAPEGITVIYGENAAGKSGYARILKKACRSRDEAEKVLPNVFQRERVTEGLEASFHLAVEGEELPPEKWILGEPPPEQLQEIAVFDSKCARLFVDDTYEVTYMPYGLDVFTKLASLCGDLRTRLESERPTVEEVPMELQEVDRDTLVGKLIGKLCRETSAKEVETLAFLSEVENARLGELSKIIKPENPEKEAKKLRRVKIRVERLRNSIIGLDQALSDDSLASLKTQQQGTKAAEEAAALASKVAFEKEPLDDTGSEPWRKMFYAAQSYSQIAAYPDKEFPFTDEGSRCVLCQQILDSDARERLQGFWNFIKEDTQKKAEDKRSLFNKSCDRFQNLNLKPDEGNPEFLAEIGEYDPNIKTVLQDYLASLEPRARKVKGALGTGSWDSIPSLPQTPKEHLARLIDSLENKALGFDKAASSTERVGLEAELKELETRRLLARHKASILKIIQQMDTVYRLAQCIGATDTTNITRTQTKLMEEATTEALRNRLHRELETLKVSHIRLEMKTTGRKGATRYQLQLPKSYIANVGLSDILSEGEHRAVAIASFLAELYVAGYRCGIVFDDPVSSLDHVRRESLAHRLVAEGKSRQVIIFTHDIVFFLAVLEEAINQRVSVEGQTISRFGNKIGVCESSVPWEAKQVNRRIEHLQGLIKRAEEAEQESNKEAHIMVVNEFYDRLRATWERAVEENVFCNTVLRFRHEVKTLSMDGIVFDDEDFGRIYRGMKRCSKVTQAHDTAAGGDHSPPEVTEMRRDLQDLRDFLSDLRGRQKAAKERRKAYTRPP